jgi:hypothetical protein
MRSSCRTNRRAMTASYRSSLTVALRQKRRFVTPVTIQNAGSTPCIRRRLG